MIKTFDRSWYIAFLINFLEIENVNCSNGWAANPLQVNGVSFFAFSQTKGDLPKLLTDRMLKMGLEIYRYVIFVACNS